jgi:hypothetical protein
MKRESPPKPDPDSVGTPQLLSARELAGRLSCSYWTARELILSGAITRVELPGRMGGPARKLLVDEADVRRFIGECKVGGR